MLPIPNSSICVLPVIDAPEDNKLFTEVAVYGDSNSEVARTDNTKLLRRRRSDTVRRLALQHPG